VKTIINVLLNENFTVASQSMMKWRWKFYSNFFFLSALATLKTTKGYALADILTELHRYVHKSNWWDFSIYGNNLENF
jgi:hypothetical protein